jgi:hypothetical protein
VINHENYILEPELVQEQIDKVNKILEHHQKNLKFLYWQLYAIKKFKSGEIVPFLENEQGKHLPLRID